METQRLTFHRHGLADFEDCAQMWGDPEVTRFIFAGRPLPRQEAWNRLLRYVGHWELLGYGFWVVREKASGRFVGEVGLADFQREMVPSLQGIPEAGWALAAWAHGQGFASEAVRAALVWEAENLRSPRTACLISPENVASLRVAEKCGFRLWQETTYKDAPILLLARE